MDRGDPQDFKAYGGVKLEDSFLKILRQESTECDSCDIQRQRAQEFMGTRP